MESWSSYPKIYNLGHAALGSLFDGPVLIEEKLDGSQFSFGVFSGELKVRSRGQVFGVDEPNALFFEAVESVKSMAPDLKDGYTYRGEYLKKPKHNTLPYQRVPKGHIAIFDVSTGLERWLSPEEKAKEAARIGLECVPVLFYGEVTGDASWLKGLIDNESMLGGAKMEGAVIKNYAQFGPDKKTLMAKHCPKCDRETEVPKVTYGLNRIRCKSCNHVFTVMAYVIVEVKK